MCGPYESDPWCHQLPSGEQIQVSVTTECRPNEEPPCTECQAQYAADLARVQTAYPANCP